MMFIFPEAAENYFVIINYEKKGISFCLWQHMLRALLVFTAINKNLRYNFLLPGSSLDDCLT